MRRNKNKISIDAIMIWTTKYDKIDDMVENGYIRWLLTIYQCLQCNARSLEPWFIRAMNGISQGKLMNTIIFIYDCGTWRGIITPNCVCE